MEQIVGIVLPVFGLIGVGYVIAWTNVTGEGSGEALAGFVFTVAIPVLLFRTFVTADFSAAAPWRLWLAYFSGFAVAWVVGDLIVRRLFGRDARAGVVGGVSSAYGNAVLIGIPLTITAYGDPGAVAIALIVAIHLPIAMTGGRGPDRARRAARRARRRPSQRPRRPPPASRAVWQPVRSSSASSPASCGGSPASRSAARSRWWWIASPVWPARSPLSRSA